MQQDLSIEKHMTPGQIISTFEHNCEYMGPIVGFKLWGPTQCYSGVLWAEDPDVNKYITNWLGSEDFAKEGPFYTASRRLFGQWQNYHEVHCTPMSSTPEEFLECTSKELEEADDVYTEFMNGKSWISKGKDGKKRWRLMYRGSKKVCRRRLFFVMDTLAILNSGTDDSEGVEDEPCCSTSKKNNNSESEGEQDEPCCTTAKK